MATLTNRLVKNHSLTVRQMPRGERIPPGGEVLVKKWETVEDNDMVKAWIAAGVLEVKDLPARLAAYQPEPLPAIPRVIDRPEPEDGAAEPPRVDEEPSLPVADTRRTRLRRTRDENLPDPSASG
jgi:hypothetical protein